MIYYQQDSNFIDIYCEIKDNYEAIVQKEYKIEVINSIHSGIFNLSDALANFTDPDDNIKDDDLLAKSEYLKSLGLDTYKLEQPDRTQTEFEPSLDNTIVTQKDPECTTEYCNSLGECKLVDVYLACACEDSHLGRNCHIAKIGYPLWENAYLNLYKQVLKKIGTTINDIQLKALHNLYFSATQFMQTSTFFYNLDSFITRAISNFKESIKNNWAMYVDFLDFYYEFILNSLNQWRASNAASGGYPYRNVTISEEKAKDYNTGFSYVTNKLLEFWVKATEIIDTKTRFIYSSKNWYIGLAFVDTSFKDEEFFKDRKESYKTYVNFMKCLNYFQIDKIANPYFQAWMIYIEYNGSPYWYNSTLYDNNTSPVIDLQFIDYASKKVITVEGCEGDNAIVVNMPFTSYKWLKELIRQKFLHDPHNYKPPNDPIFQDPIYIEPSGKVSNDSVDERIVKYSRWYNFTAKYYDKEPSNFLVDGWAFNNFTNDTNFIQFNSSHLTQFTTYFVENHNEYSILNRFFFISRPHLFKYWPNYISNYAFFIFVGFFGWYFLMALIISLYDMKFFRQESWWEFLKMEIVKVFLPYIKDKDKELKKLIPSGFNPGIRAEVIFGKKKGVLDNEQYLNNGEEENFDKLNLNKIPEEIIEEDIENDQNSNNKEVYIIKNTKNKNKVQNNYLTQMQTTGLNDYPEHKGDNEIIDFNSKKKNKFSVVETDEEEYNKRLQSYADLGLTVCQFMGHNLKQRHILIAPITTMSLFNPRWKKMTMIMTEISVLMIMTSVQLTMDENATVENLGTLFKCGFFSMLSADVIGYLLAVFFFVQYKQRKKLYHWVVSGEQLKIIQEWESMVCTNAWKTILGFIFHLLIWGFAFYLSIGFVAVWSVQKLAWAISFAIAFVFDYILFEIMFELFIAIIYGQRKKSNGMSVFGEWLNRLRNYRSLWP